LAGMGGVFNSFNLGLYSYGHLNPIRYNDPDGNSAEDVKKVVQDWWDSSVAGFKSETPTSAAMRVLEGMPQDAAMLGAFRLLGRFGTTEQVAAKSLVQANRLSGLTAEARIAARFPGAATHVTRETKLGARVIDVLTTEGTAIESKVGRVSLTKDIQRQIAKDVEMMKDPSSGVKSVEWRFSPSEVTGKMGPTAPLEKALEKAGIKIRYEPSQRVPD